MSTRTTTRIRAGVIPVRRQADGSFKLGSICSTTDKDQRVLVAGVVEAFEPKEHAALREAYEEAGLIGVIDGYEKPYITSHWDQAHLGGTLNITHWFKMSVAYIVPAPEHRDLQWHDGWEAYSFAQHRDLVSRVMNGGLID